MIESKLKKLKKAEENKILKEHGGLYNKLVKENYPQQEVSAEKNQEPSFWFTRRRVAFASAMLALLVFVGGMFLFFPKEIDNAPSNDALDASPVVTEVSIATMESVLDYTSLNTSALNVEKVNVVTTGGANDYFEVEIKTFHTLDLIVKVNPECDVPESMKPGANALKEVNAYGFEVDYTITRRRMEDYFSFNTKAVVTTESEVYYIRYNYLSDNATCELLELIEDCIKPKQ